MCRSRRRPRRPRQSGATAGWALSTWTGGWVNCLLTKSANCTNAANQDASIWDLDNEPAWWDAVHRDVHPAPSTYDEVTNGGIGTALAIKTLDSNAQTGGPVIDYWWNYFYSKKDIESGWGKGPCNQPWDNPTDRAAHSGSPMIVYYLQQMASASNTYGMRLLDYLTIHAYVAGSYKGSQVSFTAAGDTAEQQVRMNSTRALWDPTYTDSASPSPTTLRTQLHIELLGAIAGAADHPDDAVVDHLGLDRHQLSGACDLHRRIQLRRTGVD